MSKLVNQALIHGLERELDGIESCVVIGPRKLNVAETENLRTRLREQGIKMRVVRNKLAAISLERAGMPGVGDVLDGPSAVLFGGEGAIDIAKLVVELAKKEFKEKYVVLGGYFEGEVLDPAGIDQLSKAPSRPEALAMVLAGFFGPVNDFSRSMEGLLSEMHGLIEALHDKKASGEGAAA